MTTNSDAVDPALVAETIDPLFAEPVATGSVPGVAYAVALDGRVVHAGGLGTLRVGQADTPATDSVFRIASMTKSFTAATVLGLRDDGLLSLDAPVVDFVPELLAGGRRARQITVRHLLTMAGGFATDDPWGDRQQGLPISEFRALVGDGLTPSWRPGDRFEYSNLGYALLGLVVSAITSMPYPDAVDMRLLAPLGLTSTSFDPTALDPRKVATGYVSRAGSWVPEPEVPTGAFSPMGGLLSSVDDLLRWVHWLQQAWDVDEHGAGDAEDLVLSRSSRREMQTTQRLVAVLASKEPGGAPEAAGYGFGLFEEWRPWGRSISHSGGYPGFGSHMRWHPASGLSIVALGNRTYVPMSVIATKALGALVEASGRAIHRQWSELPGLSAAERAVTEWLTAAAPDDEEGRQLRSMFADNVELDVPWAERVRLWHEFRSAVPGPTTVDGSVKSASPGERSWVMASGSGPSVLQVTVLMAPHRAGLVQSVVVRVLEEPPPAPPPSTTLW